MSCSPDEDSSDRTSMIKEATATSAPATATLSSVTPVWDTSPVHVKDCTKSWQLPLVVRLFEDDAPHSSSDETGADPEDQQGSRPEATDNGGRDTGPASAQRQPFLLYTARRCSKVLAANLEWCAEKNEFVEVGPPVVVPVNYPGWFTFLTDQGIDEEHYETIEEVASASKSITSFLSRSSVTAYYLAQTSTAGKRLFLKKELRAGDVYTIREVVTERISQPTRTCCFSWFYQKDKILDDFEELKFLRCLNSSGVEVMLPFEQKGVFTPTGSEEIMEKNAAYQLPDIIRLAVLPIKVKLSFGQSPEVPCQYTGYMRFDEFFFEESVVACTMAIDQNVMLEFPMESEVHFVCAIHQADYTETAEYKHTLDFCEKNVQSYMAAMKVLQSFDFQNEQKQNTEKEDCPASPKCQPKCRSLPPLPATSKDENVVQRQRNAKECGCVHQKDSHNQTHESEGTDPDYESIHHGTRRMGKEYKFDDNGYMVPKNALDTSTSAGPAAASPSKRDSFCQTGSREDLQNMMRERRPQNVRPRNRNVDSGIQIDLASEAGANANTADELLECLSETPANERISAFLTDAASEVKVRPSKNRSNMSSVSSDHDNVFETNEEVDVFLNKMLEYNSIGDETYSMDFPLSAAALARYREQSRRRSSTEVDPSWTGSLRNRSRRNKQQNWVMDNANATIRRHNMKTLRPLMQLSLQDGENKSFEDILNSKGERFRLRREPQRRPSYRRSRSEYGTIRRVTSPEFTSTPKTDWKSVSGPKSWSDYKNEWEASNGIIDQDLDDFVPPENLEGQSVNEVAMSLHYIGLQEDVVEHFVDEQIDGKQLLELTDELLKEGFPETNALERKKIMDFIRGWRPKQ